MSRLSMTVSLPRLPLPGTWGTQVDLRRLGPKRVGTETHSLADASLADAFVSI